MTIKQINWAPSEDETLRQMWADMKPASEIGRILGRSRNSVLGRAFRLGMCNPSQERKITMTKAYPRGWANGR